MKVLSVLFDYSRYEADDTEEMNAYFALNVDPTARPLMINVDYNEATYMVTRHIREALYGSRMREELSAIEASYFDACKNISAQILRLWRSGLPINPGSQGCGTSCRCLLSPPGEKIYG